MTDVCSDGIIRHMWWYMQDNHFQEEIPKPPLRVLIFEDNKNLRAAMKMQFGVESTWLSVGILDNSREMLDIVSRMSPYGANNPNVIVLDLSAEGSDVGFEIFNAIRDLQIKQKAELGKFVDPTIIFYTSNTDVLEAEPFSSAIARKNQEVHGGKKPDLYVIPKGEDVKLLAKLQEIRTKVSQPIPQPT